MKLIDSIKRFTSEQTDGHVLGLFRMLYGLFMAYEMLYYLRINLVRNMFVLPKVNFHYDFLYWLTPLSEHMMQAIIGLLLVMALLIASGIWMRWACRLFAVGYAYIFLIDKSIYNNHIYLFILLAILLSLTDADRFLSMRSGRLEGNKIQRWQIVILQLQIVLVYFFGGVAKMTKAWLVDCQPVTCYVEDLTGSGALTGFLKSPITIYGLTYGGFLLDFLAPLLLFYKPVRKYAIFAFILFNSMNSQIFDDIGIFPFLMLAGLFIFYDTAEIPFLKQLAQRETGNVEAPKSATVKKKSVTSWVSETSMPQLFLGVYFTFQFLFPLRGYFLPNPSDYTTIGNRFSWHMKIDGRKPDKLEVTAINTANGQLIPIQVNTWINDVQMKMLIADPRAVRDFAQMIVREMKKTGLADGAVRADIRLKYNGGPPQQFVDPSIDLSRADYSPFEKITWLR